jgi:hypothetical protein
MRCPLITNSSQKKKPFRLIRAAAGLARGASSLMPTQECLLEIGCNPQSEIYNL